MAIQKFKDWRGWWDGLRVNVVKTVGTTGISFLGTNGLDSLGVSGVGMNWKTAIGQFAVHIAYEVFSYLKDKPDAQTITDEVQTTIIAKP